MIEAMVDRSCPFARLAEDLLAHAAKLDPERPAASIAEIAGALVTKKEDVEHLFQSLDIVPFSAARLDVDKNRF